MIPREGGDARLPEKQAAPSDTSAPQTGPTEQARGNAGAIDEPSDADLERGVLDAVRAGLGDVARVLAAQLEARQRARIPNVVALDSRRRGCP